MTMKNVEQKKMTKAEAGRLGGLKTATVHGSVHMSSIGYSGACVTAEKHYDDDMELMMSTLRARRRTDAVWNDKLKCWCKPAPKLN